jgi:hypothetical protein
LSGEALLFNGKPPVLPVAVLVLPLATLAETRPDGPGTIAVDVPAPGSVAVFGVLWDAPALVLSVIDGIPATDEHSVSNARNESMNNPGKENIDGKKNIRTGNEFVCSSNNVDRGISFNRASDAILYARGNVIITDATRCGTGLGKRRINEISCERILNLPTPSNRQYHKLNCTTIHTNKKEDIRTR